MRDSRNLAMMFLLGAFLSGGVLGFTANRFMNRDRVCSLGGRSSLLPVLSERLRLSKDQERTVDSILDERSRQYRIVMQPLASRMDSIKLNAREQIRRVLSPEQNSEFTAVLKEMSDTTKRGNQN